MPYKGDLGWRCNVCNDELLNSTLGNDWRNSELLRNVHQDTYLSGHILNREEDDTYLTLTISLADWHLGASIVENKSYWYYIDPNQYPDNYNFSETFPFINWWLPLPMSDYVSKLNLNQIYDVDDRVLFTINVNIHQNYISNGFPSKIVNIIAIYDGNGFLSLLKVTLPGNIALLDIRSTVIPSYTIPIIISLFIALIGFLLLYFKRMRTYKEI